MNIASSRFGEIHVDDDKILTFPHGLVGMPQLTRWALLSETGSPFLWLHSAEDPGLALVLAAAEGFWPGYQLHLTAEQSAVLAVNAGDEVEVFCVVRTAERLEDFTINLLGPVVINSANRVGAQFINDSADYNPRAGLFTHVSLEGAPRAAGSGGAPVTEAEGA